MNVPSLSFYITLGPQSRMAWPPRQLCHRCGMGSSVEGGGIGVDAADFHSLLGVRVEQLPLQQPGSLHALFSTSGSTWLSACPMATMAPALAALIMEKQQGQWDQL
jgi:hypothetical protein